MELKDRHRDDGADLSDPARWEVQRSGPARPRRVTTARWAWRPPADGLLPPREMPAPKEPRMMSAPGPDPRLSEAPGSSDVPHSRGLLTLGVILLAVVFAVGLLLGQLTADETPRPSTAAGRLRLPPASQLPLDAPLPALPTPLGNSNRLRLEETPHAATTALPHPASHTAPIAGAARTHRTRRDSVPRRVLSEPTPRKTAYRRPATVQAVPAWPTRRPVGGAARHGQVREAAPPVRAKSAPVTTARTSPRRAESPSRQGSAGTGFNQRVLKVLDRLH